MLLNLEGLRMQAAYQMSLRQRSDFKQGAAEHLPISCPILRLVSGIGQQRIDAKALEARWPIYPGSGSGVAPLKCAKGDVMLANRNLFGMLGVDAARGRLIGPADDQDDCATAPAVVSYGY
jgi:hypothetical protein